MNADIVDCPPPAYSEQDHDFKLSTRIQRPLTISEEPEDDSGQEESDETKFVEQPASASRSSSRALPTVPQNVGGAGTKGLRIHKKSSSHSFNLTQSTKPRPSWLADAGSRNLGHIPYQDTEDSLHSPYQSPPRQFVSQSDPSNHSRRALPVQPRAAYNNSPTYAAHMPANHVSPSLVPPLDFSPAMAYTRSEPLSTTTDARPVFDASAFYNSAVSSHLKSSTPRVARPRHQTSRSISSPLASNYPRQSDYMSPPTSPVPRYSPQPDTPSGVTQLPRYPSYNAPATPTASSTRWATSEHQFSQF